MQNRTSISAFEVIFLRVNGKKGKCRKPPFAEAAEGIRRLAPPGDFCPFLLRKKSYG